MPKNIKHVEFWNAEIGSVKFPIKEVADSSYKRIIIVKKLGRQNKFDTLCSFDILNSNNVVKTCVEKSENQKTTTQYQFGNNGILVKETTAFEYIKPVGIPTFRWEESIYKNGLFSKETSFTYEDTTATKFIYNPNKQIERQEMNGFTWLANKYDNKKQLIETCSYYGFGNGLSDSLVRKMKYDKSGNIIEDTRKFSPTFHKNVHLGCTTGDEFHYTYKYDSLNRVIEKRWYGKYPIERTQYFPYLKIITIDDGKINQNSNYGNEKVYFKRRDRNSEKEINEYQIKRTLFISYKSVLPEKIEFPEAQITYNFFYLR